MFKRILKSLVRVVIAVSLIIIFVSVGTFVYGNWFSQKAQDKHVREIYKKLWRQTGQIQEQLPLEIVESNTINAYNNGSKIVIYRGLINSAGSWDEIALVLGHEIAHGNLWHLRMLREWGVAKTPEEISVLEANADKLGAVYMMKAGYDVCEGRQLFKTWLLQNGDYQGGDHPGFAYRYSELNIGCE